MFLLLLLACFSIAVWTSGDFGWINDLLVLFFGLFCVLFGDLVGFGWVVCLLTTSVVFVIWVWVISFVLFWCRLGVFDLLLFELVLLLMVCWVL